MMGPFRDQKWFGIACVVLCALAGGCRRAEVSTEPPVTSSEVRADRRAFDGAPPVIPHAPLGANCTTCHNKTGMPVPSMAYAPANPHATGGRFTNCRQCHVFQQSTELFAETDFSPLLVSGRQGDRLFPGAPPTIPHATLMRENCLACHAGPAARKEIVCSHPERSVCQQCHVPSHPATPTSGLAQFP